MLLHDGPPSVHPTAKSQDLFRQLCGALLRVASEQPDPDLAINNLEQFVASTPARESLFRLWLDNEALLRVVLSLFGNSVFLSKRLIQQPDLLDTLLDPASLTRPKTTAELHHGLERSWLEPPGMMNDSTRCGVSSVPRSFASLARDRRWKQISWRLSRFYRRLATWRPCCASSGGVGRAIWTSESQRAGILDYRARQTGRNGLDFASDLDLLFVNEDAPDAARSAAILLQQDCREAHASHWRHESLRHSVSVDLGLRPGGQ
jgi:glutamine synthetase adenylyltransferase